VMTGRGALRNAAGSPLRLLLVSVALRVTASFSFDYFYLVREWNPTFCLEDACKRLPDNRFTIHGLWPQYAAGKYPSYCNRSEPYDSDVLAGIRPWEAFEWPSLTHSDDHFWSHEWMKHGTCSAMTQLEFFNKALALNEKYDLMAALNTAGIVPSNKMKYPRKDVSAALKAGLGVEAQVHCFSDEISEIYMCFTKDLEPFDCAQPYLGHSCKMIGFPLNTIDKFPQRFLRQHVMLVHGFVAVTSVTMVVTAILVFISRKNVRKRFSSFSQKGHYAHLPK